MFKIKINNLDLENKTKSRNALDSKVILNRISAGNNDMRPSEELDIISDALRGFNDIPNYAVARNVPVKETAEVIIKKSVAELTVEDLLLMVKDVDSAWRWDIFYVNVLKTIVTMLQNDIDDIQTPNSYKQLFMSYIVSMRDSSPYYDDTDSMLKPTITLLLDVDKDVLKIKLVDLIVLLYTYLGYSSTLIVLLAFKSILEDAEY